MKNFYLDSYLDLDDLHDPDGVMELVMDRPDYPDGVDDDDFTVTGCDPDEYDYDDSMEGDFDSAMTSAGWGTDEDYGFYGDE